MCAERVRGDLHGRVSGRREKPFSARVELEALRLVSKVLMRSVGRVVVSLDSRFRDAVQIFGAETLVRTDVFDAATSKSGFSELTSTLQLKSDSVP